MNGVTILFVYAVIMILATVILTKKEKNVERFCVGSRSENWLCRLSALRQRGSGLRHYLYQLRKHILPVGLACSGFWFQMPFA